MPKIIVSNLPTNFTDEDIKSIYSKYGCILNISKSPLNTFITYKLREECTKAIEGTNNKVYSTKSSVNSKPLKVDYAYDRDSKIFVFNLPLESDIVEVKSFFDYYGNIEYCKFIKNVFMIIYEDKKDALKVLDLSNKIKFADKLLNIRNTMKIEVSLNKSVFVYNLPDEITEMDFLKMFSKYGEILSSGIRDKRGFINYEKEVSAYKAVKYMEGVKIKNKKIRVTLKNNK